MDSGDDEAGEEAKVIQEVLLACHQQVSSLSGTLVGLSGGVWVWGDKGSVT